MSTAPPVEPIEIKTVYSASGRRRRSGGPRLSGPPKRTTGLVLLGLVSLTAAAGLTYATWWRIDKHVIFMTFMLRTPVIAVGGANGIDLDAAAAGLFGIKMADQPAANASSSAPSAPRYVDATARNIIIGSAYAWLTLATIACYSLSLSAGLSWGWIGGTGVRRTGLVLAVLVAVALVWAGVAEWSKYGRGYPPDHLRIGMSALALLSVLVGLALGRGTRRMGRIAAVTLILSAIGSVVGLYLWDCCGALDARHATPGFLLLVFAVHSALGWILLPLASRAGR